MSSSIKQFSASDSRTKAQQRGGFTRSHFSLIGLCPRYFIGPSNLCRIENSLHSEFEAALNAIRLVLSIAEYSDD
ncbi:hypothetical protein T03_3377 [Trichinella britovi]|uniref:Uncharacterized protein n=1 Tax=Trichinella britovi TaxID=45882 RepID=A0A0V1C419_TRIBR|nr:hypothetical protein T03_3377 [Trichinella britovi]